MPGKHWRTRAAGTKGQRKLTSLEAVHEEAYVMERKWAGDKPVRWDSPWEAVWWSWWPLVIGGVSWREEGSRGVVSWPVEGEALAIVDERN